MSRITHRFVAFTLMLCSRCHPSKRTLFLTISSLFVLTYLLIYSNYFSVANKYGYTSQRYDAPKRNSTEIGVIVVASTAVSAKNVKAFINHACNSTSTSLKLRPLFPIDKVTISIFSHQSASSSLIKLDPGNLEQCQIEIINFNEAVHLKSKTPCDVIWGQTEVMYDQYYKNFDYTLYIDSSTRFKLPLFQIGDSIAAINNNRTIQLKEKLFDNSQGGVLIPQTHFYSPYFFGGSVETLRHICGNVTSDSTSVPFSYKINAYFAQFPPHRIYNTTKHNFSLKSVENREIEQFENYLKSFQIHRISHFHAKRSEELAEGIRSSYFQTNGQFLRNYMKFPNKIILGKKYLIYSYDFPSTMQRPEFSRLKYQLLGGHQLRGMTVALYLAIASNRIFHLNFTDVGNFFSINHEMLVVDATKYDIQLNLALNSTSIWMIDDRQNDVEFVKNLAKDQFSNEIAEFDCLKLATQRYASLQGIVENNVYESFLRVVLSDSMSNDFKTDFSLLISAAFRAIFHKPKVEFADYILEPFVGAKYWSNSTRIGIDLTSELQTNILSMFVEEIKAIVDGYLNTAWSPAVPDGTIVVFIAHLGNNNAEKLTEEILKAFQGDKINVHFYPTVKEGDQISIENETVNSAEWKSRAKLYGQFYLLTQCDYLLITERGQMGEMAAMMASKPTRRLIYPRSDKKKDSYRFQDYYNLNMPTVTSDDDVYDFDLN